jgi:hypothetical protein
MTGKTYREQNAEKVYNVPIGALVEIDTGVRLFVVYHARDCDQTPLYCLAADANDMIKEIPSFSNRKWDNGYAEHSLSVIKATPQNYRLTSYGYKRRALLLHLKNISERIVMIVLHLEHNWDVDYLVVGLERESNKIISLMERNNNE